MNVSILRAMSATAVLSLATAAVGQVKVDPAIPSYSPVTGVSGTFKSAGSNTLVKVTNLWVEGFKKHYPSVVVEVEGKGSGSAPSALIEGTAAFGAMSRDMKQKEIDDFEKQFGYKPTAIATSIDMLAVYVHKDNPISQLTMQQVDAIFSKTRKAGAQADALKWGDLGLTGEWADKRIVLYGRDSTSGTNQYFKEHALVNGDFKDGINEQPGSSGVVQAVARDKFGVGYSGIGFLTADVRAVPLANSKGDVIAASPENAYSGKYPMSRFLYLYVNQKPGTELDPLRREFLRYVLSRDGQSDVVKEGFYPLTPKLVTDAAAKVGLKPSTPVEAGASR